jgi:hypothetical protein
MTKKLGRPREIDPTGEKGGTKTIAVTIASADYTKVKQIAQVKNVKMSKVLREAIDQYLAQN